MIDTPLFSGSGTVKACTLGAVAASTWNPTSPPEFSPSEVASKLIHLPDGRKVTVGHATGEEFRMFIVAMVERIVSEIDVLAEQVAREQGPGKASRIRGVIAVARVLQAGFPRHSDLLERWHALLELAHFIGGGQSKYHIDVQLFVEQEVA
jgi:hypothetical protein